MVGKEKVCRNDKLFVKGNVCPICNKADFTKTWKGIIIVSDPTDSEVAKLMAIKVPGKYCIWAK